MNDLDDLKEAMHSTPGFEPKPMDLDQVMRTGGRMRRRRQFAIGATSGVAVLALLVGGAQLTRATGSEVAGPALSSAAPVVSATPDGDDPSDPGEVLGEVVETGMKVDGMDRVLWIRRLAQPELPDTTIALVTGWREPGGRLVADVLTNETEGPDRAPGFHGLEMAMEVNYRETPAFGYYAGPAAKITVVADGRTVRARQATWSEDPSVVLFWFDLKKVKPTSRVGKASAYDGTGRKLPAGNSGFAVG